MAEDDEMEKYYNTRNRPVFTRWRIQFRFVAMPLFVAMASFPLFARDVLPFNLGCGDPTLHIVYNTSNQYIIYLNELPMVKNTDIHSGGYPIDTEQRECPKRQIILTSTEKPSGGDPEVLYPFGEQMAFTCPYGGSGWTSDKEAYNLKKYHYWPRKTQVFSTLSTNKDDILVSEDVYALARSRYGLTTNQLFLGKIGTNIFYWETRDPTKVYYHAAEQAQATDYFKLPKGVLDLFGVTKSLRTNDDVGIWASRKRHWVVYGLMPTTAPYETAVFEFSFKDAKQVKSDQ